MSLWILIYDKDLVAGFKSIGERMSLQGGSVAEGSEMNWQSCGEIDLVVISCPINDQCVPRCWLQNGFIHNIEMYASIYTVVSAKDISMTSNI